jgi:hypothetical protein
MNSNKTNILDVSEIELTDSPESLEKANYLYFKTKFFDIVNKLFFKKLSGHHVNDISKLWKKNIPRPRIKHDLSVKFSSCLHNIQEIYNADLNIKCVNYPIGIEVDNQLIIGKIDLITQKKSGFVLYIFLTEERADMLEKYLNLLPGIVTTAFYDEFGITKFNVIIFNTVNKKSYKIMNAWKKNENLMANTRKVLKQLSCKENDIQEQ